MVTFLLDEEERNNTRQGHRRMLVKRRRRRRGKRKVEVGAESGSILACEEYQVKVCGTLFGTEDRTVRT